MNRFRTVILLMALMALTACKENKFQTVNGDLTGVWADKDTEVLRTDKYCLLFDRCDTLLTSSLHYIQNDSVFLLGRVIFSPSKVVEQTVWNEPVHVKKTNVGLLLTNGLLQIETQHGVRELTKIEDITMVKPYEMAHASLSAIGSCVQEWNMGIRVNRGDDLNKGQLFFEAGTNQHNYTFGIYPNFIYCRASRLRFNDHGGLFDQNIRMMSNGREQTSYMVEDNLAISSQPLMIDNTKFKNDMCVFSEDGIYWSFIEFDGDVAVLNGCGEIYRFKRPENKESYMEEWVEFKKY